MLLFVPKSRAELGGEENIYTYVCRSSGKVHRNFPPLGGRLGTMGMEESSLPALCAFGILNCVNVLCV